MADEEERGDLPSRGNEWEVVSLTASTFAAAPSEKALESTHDEFPRDEEEFSSALFMSKHFIFPPSKHENLPIEHDAGEIHNETGSEEGIGTTEASGVDSHLDEGDKFTKDEDEKWKGLPEVQDIPGIYLFDEGKKLSDQGSEFEGQILEGLNLVPDEESIYTTSKCTSFPGEAESSVVFEPDEPSQINPDSPVHPKTEKENKVESGLPCEAWWRRCATSFYSHAKEANTFWSVVVAAALMGLVVLGQRWQQESWQLRQLKWQIGVNDECENLSIEGKPWCHRKVAPLFIHCDLDLVDSELEIVSELASSLSRVFGPVSRLKDALVDQPRGPTIHGGSSAKR